MKVPRFNFHPMRGFTLIELLVVVSIIAILASLGVTGAYKVMENARKLEAKTAMTGLETAIKAFQTDYHRLPTAGVGLPAEDNEAYDTTTEEGRTLLLGLLARDRQLNPREKRYWDAPAAKSGSGGYSSDRGLRDPWGNGYQIIIDYSGDGIIDNPYASGTDEPPDLNTNVIVYCAGPNKTLETGGAANGKKVDDVKSWQK